MFEPITVKKRKYPLLVAAAVLFAVAVCFALLFFSGRMVMPAPSSHRVSDFRSLAELAEEGVPDGDTVIFTGDFKLEDSVVFDSAVSLDFQKKPDFNGYSVTVTGDADLDISLTAAQGVRLSVGEVIFDCPDCDLTWKADSVPEMFLAGKYMNFESLNGVKVSDGGLGGKGKARITAVTLKKEDNPWLGRDIECDISGKEITATLPYLVSGFDIQNVRLSVQADGEYSYIGCLNSDGSVNMTGKAVISVSDGEETYNYRLLARRDGLDLPVIYIDTEDNCQITSKDEYVNATLTIDSNGYEDFESVEFAQIRIEGRGNSSWEFDKKPYKLRFSEKISVFGLAEATDYALFANYTDKSLMRNRVALEMAKELSFDYTPTQYPADVFLNGDYIGVYTFGEHLETGEGRVDIKPELGVDDTEYFIEVGGVESGVNTKGYDYFHAGLIEFALIKAPIAQYMTDSQFCFIRDWFLKTNEAIVSGQNYSDYIDVGSLIDWLIMTELTNNTDSAFRRSCYFTKKAGGKLKMGPVWDHDLAFGNFIRDSEDYSTWATSTDDDYVGTTWSTYLFEDEEFMHLFALRWMQVKDKLLDRAYEVIETTAEQINRSQVYNFTVWDILDERVKFERNDVTEYNTFKKQVLYLMDFLETRSEWLDKTLSKYL